MITINFYNYSDNPKIVNKTLPIPTAFNGLLYDSTNVFTPTVKIRNSNFDYKFYNYCYIPILQRFYFVENVSIIQNNVVELNLRLDLLKTFSQSILNSSGTVVSRENANKYIVSRENVYDIRPQFTKIDFSVNSPFNSDGQIIMITLKGN